MIELSIEYDVNTRDDFSGNVYLGSSVNFPKQDIGKAWNNQYENDDQQDIVNAFVYEVYEDIKLMALFRQNLYTLTTGDLKLLLKIMMLNKRKRLN